MAQNYKEGVFARDINISFVVGPQDIYKIPEIIKKVLRGQSPCADSHQSSTCAPRSRRVSERVRARPRDAPRAPRTVAPLLVYTELLFAGGKRAREAASEVLQKYLAHLA